MDGPEAPVTLTSPQSKANLSKAKQSKGKVLLVPFPESTSTRALRDHSRFGVFPG